MFFKRRIKKNLKIFLKKNNKKQCSKGARVAPYSVVGPYRVLFGLQKTCNPKSSRTKQINF
jgi:hypothetical protein